MTRRAIRNIAVGLPVRSGHVLVLEGADSVKGQAFYRAIGGGMAHVFAVDSAELDAITLDAELHVLDEGSPVRWVPINGAQHPFYPHGITRILSTRTAPAALAPEMFPTPLRFDA